ncbi:MAG: hypothetical protein H0X47_10325 [Nitrospirales bacterium]|nr:hypothetical protein [Nitrospirales bacterium]
MYVIKDNQGKSRRLRIDPLVLKGADPKIGDMIKGKIETGGDIHQLIAAMEFEKVSESVSE